MRKLAIGGLLTVVLLGCGDKKADPPQEVQRTEREKAEIVAGSSLPRARSVRKLLVATDSIQSRNDRLESMVP